MRKIIIAISACIVLLLGGFAGYRGYQVWKQNHLLSLAKMFSDQHDPRNEALCLQQVLNVNPRNVEACRRLAALSEAGRSPAALIWRERVVALAPDALEDRLALAQCALIFKEFDVATNALAAVDEAGKKTAAYQNLAGVMAITLKQPAEAEAHFVEASRLEPWNQVPQLNLAVIHLRSTNSLDTAEARITLKRLSQNPTNANIRVQAMRELVTDSIRTKDLKAAAVLSADLISQTNASFNDKLMNLDILKETKGANYTASLAKCQGEAATNTANLTDMTAWLMTRTGPKATLTWLQGLSPAIQTNSPGVLLLAECQTQLKNWPQLQHALEKQDWKELDFLRHAYLSRALREQNLTGAATAEWELAIKFASSQKVMQISLFKIAATWRWSNEAEQILWTIVNRYPEEKWADHALQQALLLGGRTRPLMQLLSLQAKRQPDNLATMNDLAMTAMLLDAKEISPFEISRKVYEQAPKNSSFASTYAFSLYLQKQYGEALAVMQKLSPEQLNQPSIAGYYGLILKASGEAEKAQTYLNWALSKGRLLPEERQMFQQALKK